MEAIKAQTKQKSDKAIVNDLLAEYAMHDKAIRSQNAAKKELEMQLLEMAEENPQWFEESKTLTVENGQIKWIATSKVVTPEGFDLSAFAKKFPTVVKVKTSESIQIAKLRVFLEDPKHGKVINDLGVSIESTDKFSVVAN